METQRTIKFRAWTGKEMTNEIRLESAHGIRLVSSSDLAPHDMSDDKVVFMQFTGLQDKNGREIFEGDIVKIEDSYTPTYNAEIKWIGNGFWLTDGRGGNFLPVEKNREVVGNLYESPDLLAQK